MDWDGPVRWAIGARDLRCMLGVIDHRQYGWDCWCHALFGGTGSERYCCCNELGEDNLENFCKNKMINMLPAWYLYWAHMEHSYIYYMVHYCIIIVAKTFCRWEAGFVVVTFREKLQRIEIWLPQWPTGTSCYVYKSTYLENSVKMWKTRKNKRCFVQCFDFYLNTLYLQELQEIFMKIKFSLKKHHKKGKNEKITENYFKMHWLVSLIPNQ